MKRNQEEDSSSLLDEEELTLHSQPSLNIGIIGHVAHGKTTLVAALTGIRTTRHTKEKIRNMTIYLGYANVKIWKCDDCGIPEGYSATGSGIKHVKCDKCHTDMRLVKHISLVDCPGHDILVETMLCGASVMDEALMVIDASKVCPQTQTEEHLNAVESLGIENYIIVQNKVDLLSKEEVLENYEGIKMFIGNTKAKNAPIVPLSAQRKLNIKSLCHYLSLMPIPPRDLDVPPLMRIVRSFDINKPGAEVEDIMGGVAGGTLTRGTMRVGDEIELRPGIIVRECGVIYYRPIISRVLSMMSELNSLEYAIPGGLIGVSTDIDPSLAKSDSLVGQVIGHPGQLPPVYKILEITYIMKQSSHSITDESNKLIPGETIELCIGSGKIRAHVDLVKDDVAKLTLHLPQCTEIGTKIGISRREQKSNNWRLIAWGTIREGSIECDIYPH